MFLQTYNTGFFEATVRYMLKLTLKYSYGRGLSYCYKMIQCLFEKCGADDDTVISHQKISSFKQDISDSTVLIQKM